MSRLHPLLFALALACDPAPDTGEDTGGGGEDTDSGVDTDTDDNTPPTADAGDDRVVDGGRDVILDATGSLDAEGDDLVWLWEQIEGPLVILSDPASPTPVFAAPNEDATLVFRVTVSDGELSSEDTVSITLLRVERVDVRVEDNPHYRLSLGGCRDGVVASERAFLACNHGLSVVDVSDRARPRELSRVEVDDAYVWEVDVADGVAWLGGDALYAIDVSDPDAPVTLWRWDDDGALSFFTGIDVQDGVTWFLANGALGALDAAGLSSPVLLGRGTVPGGSDLEVRGTHALVANRASDFQVWDVSDPSAPALLRQHLEDGSAHQVAVDGGVAATANNFEGVVLYDVTDPTASRRTAVLADVGDYDGVDLSGGLLFASRQRHGLRVWDVSDPDAPVHVADYALRGSTLGAVALGDGWVLVQTDGAREGVQLVDVSRSSRRLLRGESNRFDGQAVVLGGDTAWVASGTGGLRALDVSDPSAPTQLSRTPTYAAKDVDLQGTLLALADTNAFRLFDTTDPVAPVELATHPHGYNHCFGVQLDGDVLYGSAYDAGAYVLDVSEPTAPVLLGSGDELGIAATAVADGTAWITSGTSVGSQDVSDPASISTVHWEETGLETELPAVEGDRLYVSGDALQLRVADPLAPVLHATWPSWSGFWHLTPAGDVLYAADGYSGIAVLDVSEPAHPGLFGRLDTPGHAREVVERDGVLYVAAAQAGLLTLDAPAWPVLWGPERGLVGETATFVFTWTDLEAAEPALHCEVAAGSCTLDVDHDADAATVTWELPDEVGDYALVVTVGSFDWYLAARTWVRAGM